MYKIAGHVNLDSRNQSTIQERKMFAEFNSPIIIHRNVFEPFVPTFPAPEFMTEKAQRPPIPLVGDNALSIITLTA
jgi:hypothetical protein